MPRSCRQLQSLAYTSIDSSCIISGVFQSLASNIINELINPCHLNVKITVRFFSSCFKLSFNISTTTFLKSFALFYLKHWFKNILTAPFLILDIWALNWPPPKNNISSFYNVMFMKFCVLIFIFWVLQQFYEQYTHTQKNWSFP